MSVVTEMASLVWSIADLLRGPYRPNQYKDVMLPLTVLRRLDCLLEPFKDKVTARLKRLEGGKIKNLEAIIQRETGLPFYNSSRFTFRELVDAPDDLPNNLRLYIKRFSSRVSGIIDHFGFEEHIDKLDKSGRLFLVVKKFAELDLHPQRVKNDAMGYIFEELIRRFNEASNEEAGDHFTPREVIRLMVEVLFDSDDKALTTDGIVKTLYDPACGTGGMLSCAEEFVHKLNGDGRLEVFGQDYNDQAYAICGSDMLIKGQNIDHIAFGNSFTQDKFNNQTFDYLLANPPFGVEWKPEEKFIRDEHEKQGFVGRFGAGLPRINDGALLFLQQMWAKRKEPTDGGTRMVIVFNGSPLFTGGAGSGESEIRRWVIENDWLEAIIALPDQLFYNTGIKTYLWVLSNRKEKVRRGKVALIDGTSFFKKMRKSLGNKRNEICDQQRADIVRLYGEFVDGPHVRIFDSKEFGFHRVTVERPLRLNFAITEERLERVQNSRAFASLATSRKRKDSKAAEAEIASGEERQHAILTVLRSLASQKVVKNRKTFAASLKTEFNKATVAVPAPLFKAIVSALSDRDETAEICLDTKGNAEPASELRDYEHIPLRENIEDYMAREVLPHVPDAWVDASKTKIGYEINFNRYFYRYTPPRPLKEIETDLRRIERKISELLLEVAK